MANLNKRYLGSIGIGAKSDMENIYKTAFEKLKEKFNADSLAEINSEESKSRTYTKLKTESGLKSYIEYIGNIMDRTAITKIRLSNHEVMIENGRHQGLQLNQRPCPFCRKVVENEQHFITSCETLKVHRIKLLTQMSGLNTNFLHNLLKN